MQPFDALAMRAVLQEAAPLLLNRRVDEVSQVGRDEILLAFRGRTGVIDFRICAHAVYGRLCLVKTSTHRKQTAKGNEFRSSFVTLLKKGLSGATLVAIEQLKGERILDFIFSCVDELGGALIKTLTAEIMGRHSNIIFWERASQNILTSSHVVTKEMSRHRQILPGLKYIRPPGQTRPSIFEVGKDDFSQPFEEFRAESINDRSVVLNALESWLTSRYSGLGKNLAEEICRAAIKQSNWTDQPEALKEHLWQSIVKVQNDRNFKPAMKSDLSRYTIFNLDEASKEEEGWQILPAVNDLIEQFYSAIETGATFRQQKERMLKEVGSEIDKLKGRRQAMAQWQQEAGNTDQGRLFGNLILANLSELKTGQTELVCQNTFAEGDKEVVIALNANLTGVQNAQSYYRHFAKARNRLRTVELTQRESELRLQALNARQAAIEKAQTVEELRAVTKGMEAGLIKRMIEPKPSYGKEKSKPRLLTLTSSDGWLIYVGRNRHENDQLIRRVAQPRDVWLHILGHSGAHVLIKVPSGKDAPPLTTIKEGAYVAARFSKMASGAKVRVVYTEIRFVRRTGNGKSGMVKYENEKTIEVDTGASLPKIMKQLFA
jgi:predicted ribosome quality control (RQC) complex YloA/Tae2 family protein